MTTPAKITLSREDIDRAICLLIGHEYPLLVGKLVAIELACDPAKPDNEKFSAVATVEPVK
jgi:hypothetical protein